MNVRFVFLIGLIVMCALPLMVTGQDKKDSGSVTVTGCLNKGAAADQYVIKDTAGKETMVTGDAKLLAGHANNHQVTITGSMSKDKENKEVLRATDLKMISICE